MRRLVLTAALVGAAALAGCGKKQEAVMPAAPADQASTEAPAKTPEQTKAMLATLPAAFQDADLADGERQSGQCRSCHSFAKGGANMTGPHLWAAVGRKAGSVPDFNYSDALKKSGLTWDAATLDKWIEHPRELVPDTKMSFLGIKDPNKRKNLIAWLRTQADN